MSTFTTEIYIYTPDGEEHEIPVTVDYSATHDNGDAENPPGGSMTIKSITPTEALPDGVRLDMASALQLSNIEEDAWEHYFSKGVDDED